MVWPTVDPVSPTGLSRGFVAGLVEARARLWRSAGRLVVCGVVGAGAAGTRLRLALPEAGRRQSCRFWTSVDRSHSGDDVEGLWVPRGSCGRLAIAPVRARGHRALVASGCCTTAVFERALIPRLIVEGTPLYRTIRRVAWRTILSRSATLSPSPLLEHQLHLQGDSTFRRVPLPLLHPGFR